MAKVFVGNFDFSVDEDKLKDYFSSIGEVLSVRIMRDSVSGKSRGFGFVEFSEEESCQKAIEQYDGQNWEGRPLKISEERRRGEEFSPVEDDTKGAPMGFFRAQPLEIGQKKKRNADPFTEDETLKIDYKDVKTLMKFVSERGRILPRRMTGLTAHNQRLVTQAIKRSQHVALMPHVKGSH